MEQTVNAMIQPWYRQAWPWFLIALPASAVIGCMVTIFLATHSPNALVADDYYKQGLAINQQKQRLRHADQMNMSGLVRTTSEGKLSLELESDMPVSEPALTLKIIHFTRSELDQTLELERQPSGLYVAKLPKNLRDGTWYLRVRPQDTSWELRSRIIIDGGAFQALLTSTD